MILSILNPISTPEKIRKYIDKFYNKGIDLAKGASQDIKHYNGIYCALANFYVCRGNKKFDHKDPMNYQGFNQAAANSIINGMEIQTQRADDNYSAVFLSDISVFVLIKPETFAVKLLSEYAIIRHLPSEANIDYLKNSLNQEIPKVIENLKQIIKEHPEKMDYEDIIANPYLFSYNYLNECFDFKDPPWVGLLDKKVFNSLEKIPLGDLDNEK